MNKFCMRRFYTNHWFIMRFFTSTKHQINLNERIWKLNSNKKIIFEFYLNSYRLIIGISVSRTEYKEQIKILSKNTRLTENKRNMKKNLNHYAFIKEKINCIKINKSDDINRKVRENIKAVYCVRPKHIRVELFYVRVYIYYFNVILFLAIHSSINEKNIIVTFLLFRIVYHICVI